MVMFPDASDRFGDVKGRGIVLEDIDLLPGGFVRGGRARHRLVGLFGWKSCSHHHRVRLPPPREPSSNVGVPKWGSGSVHIRCAQHRSIVRWMKRLGLTRD